MTLYKVEVNAGI